MFCATNNQQVGQPPPIPTPLLPPSDGDEPVEHDNPGNTSRKFLMGRNEKE